MSKQSLKYTALLTGVLVMSAYADTPKQSVVKKQVSVLGGTYRPLYLNKDTPMVTVKPFKIDNLPVTNAEFSQFVKANPKWQKNNIAKLFAENDYLKLWQKIDDTYAPKPSDLNKPVVYVSWYAAQAYCKAQGKNLPSVAQWEYVGSASQKHKIGSQEVGYNQTILDWYAKASSKPMSDVGQTPANYWGVYDMHGLIWEWTYDFNNSLSSGESRSDSSLNKAMFCGSGAAGAADPSDYAAFMRYGFRSSLEAKFTLNSLGFRCAS